MFWPSCRASMRRRKRMGQTIKISIPDPEEKAAFEQYAAAKGMSLSGLAKMALYQYRAKYPLKEHGKGGSDRVTVQSRASGGDPEEG